MSDEAQAVAGGNPAFAGWARYKLELAAKHERTVTGGACDSYVPRGRIDGDHVVVHCDTCGVVLHRIDRDSTGETP